MSTAGTAQQRLTSLDQFRGYTVAGMCLVNYLAPFAAIHPILKHNETYFSYADTIMPGFLFVVGFAFRLTYLKRRRDSGRLRTAWTYVRRSGRLLLLSLLIYVFVGDVPRWFLSRDMPPEFGRETTAERPVTMAAGRETDALRPRSAELASGPLAADGPLPPVIQLPPSSVTSAIERLRAWRKLGWPSRLLIHWRILTAKLIKSDLWETLAIIGATQLVILPWIGCQFWTRFLVMAALGATHCAISYWFNWDFLYGVNGNWMSSAWMTGDDRGWDGGVFGPLNWGVVMLGGTLAYDLVSRSATRSTAIPRLVLWGLAFLAVGYLMSCLTRLYDLSRPELVAMRRRHLQLEAEKARLDDAIARERALLATLKKSGDRTPVPGTEQEKSEGAILVWEDLRRESPDLSLAKNPVLPPWERFRGRSLSGFFAEPPFVAPPADDPRTDPPPCIEHRLRNYWMLGKRMPNLSFVTFATGFQFVLLAVFVAACDVGGFRVGLFRTLGTNPLAAYFIHGMMALILALLVPHDVPLVYCLAGFAVAFAVTYLLVRLLERRNLFWRL